MSDWKPEKEQERYLQAVLSMTTDSLMGRGVADVETYCSNLRAIAEILSPFPKEAEQ